MLDRSRMSEVSPEPTTLAIDLQSPAFVRTIVAQMMAEPVPQDGIGRPVAKIVQAHIDTMNAVARQLAGEAGKRLFGAIERFDDGVRRLEPAARELGQRGWTIPVWQPLPFISWVATSVAPEHVDAFFESLYAENRPRRAKEVMTRVLSAKQYAHWAPLLDEIVTSIKSKRYLVAVPALLSVFEGTIAAAANRSYDKASPNEIAEQTLDASDLALKRLGWASILGFLTTVFGYHSFASAAPATLNRHWVLHGHGQPKWTRLDCLRLFQAVETLSVVGWPFGTVNENEVEVA